MSMLARLMSRRLFRVSLAGACAIAVTACASDTIRETTEVSERDSAGVVILEQSAAHLAALPTLTIDSIAEFSINGADTANAFTSIVVVAQLPDRRVLLYDARHRELREYSANGAFLRVVMPNGRGPGEVDYVNRIQVLPDDRFAVFDGNLRRISLFDSRGELIEQRAYPRFEGGARAGPIALLEDSRLLASMRAPRVEPTVFDGVTRRDTFAIVAIHTPVDSASESLPRVDTIALVPDSEVFDVVTTQNGESWPDTDFVRLGPTTNLVSDGARVVLGTNEQRYELREYRQDRLSRLLRVEQAPERVPADAGDRVRTIVAAEMERQPLPASAKADFAKMRENWRFATVFPFHERLFIGTDGTLWAQAPGVWPTDAQRYLVFDNEGRAVARVELPERVTPHVMSLDRVLGVWLDEDDVPHVKAWRLRGAP